MKDASDLRQRAKRAPHIHICLMLILDGKARRLYYRVMFPVLGHKVRKSFQQRKQTRFCSSRQVFLTIVNDVTFWILGIGKTDHALLTHEVIADF